MPNNLINPQLVGETLKMLSLNAYYHYAQFSSAMLHEKY